jgi:hypothetical protein
VKGVVSPTNLGDAWQSMKIDQKMKRSRFIFFQYGIKSATNMNVVTEEEEDVGRFVFSTHLILLLPLFLLPLLLVSLLLLLLLFLLLLFLMFPLLFVLLVLLRLLLAFRLLLLVGLSVAAAALSYSSVCCPLYAKRLRVGLSTGCVDGSECLQSVFHSTMVDGPTPDGIF